MTSAGDDTQNSKDLPLLALLDSAPDGFIVVDGDGVIVFANRTAEVVFRYNSGELIAQPITRLIPERFRRSHLGHIVEYRENPHVRPMGLGLNLFGRRKDGAEFPVEISLSPLQTPSRSLFTAIVRDVTERKQLDEEHHLLEVELETERERDRIAMDLHDGILQDIYAAALTLELAESGTEDSKYADAAAVDRAIDQLHRVVMNIRSYIFDLRPREFGGNLSTAVQNLAQEFEQNSQVKTITEIDDQVAIDGEVAMAIYHITHEALSNVQRHAGAKNVKVSLRFGRRGSGTLQVKDDGRGFDTTNGYEGGHHGLRNMAKRAHSVGAHLNVESTPSSGTTVTVTFATLES